MSGHLISFTKMSAGGNDFIVIDNVSAPEGEGIRPDAETIRRLCARALSVGADGVILIEPAAEAHVKMVYFNSDGGRAALCGNGVRCVARMAALRRFAPSDGMRIETDAGTLDAAVEGDRPWFRLPLGVPDARPRTLQLEGTLDEVSRTVQAVQVLAGVPHLVIETRDARGMSGKELMALAPRLRSHPDLGPEGANVDFITLIDDHTLDIRCYERGVEAETVSSGSGCIASALAVVLAGRAASPVSCRSRAGTSSTVTLEPQEEGAFNAVLSGDARVIYTAALNAEALSGFDL